MPRHPTDMPLGIGTFWLSVAHPQKPRFCVLGIGQKLLSLKAKSLAHAVTQARCVGIGFLPIFPLKRGHRWASALGIGFFDPQNEVLLTK
jgi:hypothetical protein